MSDRALIVFLKHPEPGSVKTRLAPVLGDEGAAALYRVVAEEVLRETVPRRGEYETLVFFAPPDAAGAMRAWLPGTRLLPQSGEGLGARMHAAFVRAFERGAERVVLIGTDTFGVTRETVEAALDALGSADVVLGPAEDGGYYLIALSEPRPELFEGMAWSTPTVLEETEARAAGLRVRRLASMRDIDTPEDLRAEWRSLRPLLDAHPELREQIEARLGLP